MNTLRRLLLGLAVGVTALAAAGCADDASVVADPAPAAIEAPSIPAAASDVRADDVDTQSGEATAADTASTAVPVRDRGQQSTPTNTNSTEQTYRTIRDVDFMNGFTYESDLEFGPPETTVDDGSYSNGEFGDSDYYWFGAVDVDFGDVDGDGSEEAVVTTTWNSGGTGYFDAVRAFRLVEGQVEAAGVVPFGDRGDGGVFDVRVEDGSISVWSFSTTLGACCPNEIRATTLVLGDHWLAQADRGPTRTFFSSNASDDNELKFLPGTSSAIVAIYGYETQSVFTFDAAQGQVLSVALAGGPAATEISVTSLATGQVMSAHPDVVLPEDGFYQVDLVLRRGTR